ncbi:MAG: hypothetical protein LBF81_06270 [Prevotellaceae bacterium]|jgi:hypothetical protein|nr:hypothetical protein [Prevotellaceae bacterium]
MYWKIIFTLLHIAAACTVARQDVPAWADSRYREQNFPSSLYFTGFTMGNVRSGEDLPELAGRLKKEAQALLSESIRVKIESETQLHSQSSSDNTTGIFHTVFTSAVHSAADAEIVNLKTETYFDKAKKTLYAFAYANKRELITYYTATVADDMQQIQGAVKTAGLLERQREKAKARKQYENAAKLLAKAANVTDLLRALGAQPSGNALQASGQQALREEIAQALARLELLVYVNDREELFGQPCAIVANKLKAALATQGYHFTEDPAHAEFTLNLHATTRKIGDAGSTIVFCFADVEVEWIDNYAQKSVYKEELSHKGGSTTFERAGREALEEAAAFIAEKLKIIY